MIRNARTGEVGEELLLRWKVAVTSPVAFSPLLFLSLARGTLLNPCASPPSHLRNIYQLACQSAGFNTSLEVVLHVCSPKGKPQGMSAIAASHRNPSDHVSILQGSFVAAFASSNLGDVSPNTKGPFCVNTGESCDNPQSTCPVGGVRMDYSIYSKLWWRRKLRLELQIQSLVLDHSAWKRPLLDYSGCPFQKPTVSCLHTVFWSFSTNPNLSHCKA